LSRVVVARRCEASTRAKWRSSDCTDWCASKVLDSAALAVDLEQSPFLNILSDRKIGATLKLMGHAPTEHVTADVARELCLRTGSKAILAGSVSSLGTQYVIGLEAVTCSTGDTLAKEQAEAASKEGVLKALGTAATSLRARLGESLASVQKFDVPVEATTPSLEALKAYSMGFAIAYAGLAVNLLESWTGESFRGLCQEGL